jgi:hypothetical protein
MDVEECAGPLESVLSAQLPGHADGTDRRVRSKGGFLYHPSFVVLYHLEYRAKGATAVATVATPMLPSTRLR